MFGCESATESERHEFLVWVSDNYSSEDPDKKEAIEILSMFYVNQDLPLCGMKSWFKRDYTRFCNGATYIVDRHRPKEKSTHSVYTSNSRSGDPSWRGSNGTWSLD